MEKLFTFLIGVLIFAIVLYLLGAFVVADFNIANWHPLGRLVIAILFMFGSGTWFYCVFDDK